MTINIRIAEGEMDKEIQNKTTALMREILKVSEKHADKNSAQLIMNLLVLTMQTTARMQTALLTTLRNKRIVIE